MFAFVTLVTSDGYLPGALTLAASLRELHPSDPTFEIVAIVTPESVDVATIKLLRRAFDQVVGVEILAHGDGRNLKLLGRPDLNTVLTKLHVFRLTQYSKVIFLDADVLPIRPIAQLFSLPHDFSAVPDVGWPDIFNSGVLVLSPAESSFSELNDLLQSKGTWDGGDQGILNEWRGNNWNRLSFTYNTTPTAAYTYAPAYERFGSQISVIHFIGPNKPWKSLPWRAPGTILSSRDTSLPQQAYEYSALVDRWYAVYDKHYRAESIAVVPETEFGVKRYISAWDDQAQKPAEISSRQTASSILGLEDLKRVALEGMTNSRPVVSSRGMAYPSGEGRYSSMPLEGRLDLMRRKLTEKPASVDSFNSPSQSEDADAGKERWHTLPTPGPSELPPTPHLQPQALPPTSEGFPPPSSSPSSREPDRHDHQHHQEQHPRPASPPMLVWNAAVDPPPNNPPPSSAFPADTYFPNVWDNTPSRVNDQAHQFSQPKIQIAHPGPGTAPTPDSGAFFHPPPASKIPASLRDQGHYSQVTGKNEHGHTPTPDPTKVKHVFPWEDKPRQMPGRVFPESDPPKPSAYVQEPSTPVAVHNQNDGETTPRAGVPLGAQVQVTIPSPMHSPLRGLPTTLAYKNAWDTVPSIQNYASRLVRPKAPQLSPSFPPRRRGSDSPEKYEDANSRDGDDEDSEEEQLQSQKSVSPARSRSASGSSGYSVKGKKKEYRVRGVQTISPEMRSIGVQVSITIQPNQLPQQRPPAHVRKVNVSASSQTSSANIEPHTLLPSSMATEPIPVGTARPRATSSSISKSSSSTSIGRTPRSFAFPGSSPTVKVAPALTSQISVSSSPPLAKTTPPLLSPVSRSVDSPISSTGPLSPTDSQSITFGSPGNTVRKHGRVFDPSTGVDLFKRGSEEVLARFLKMGSWEDDVAAQASNRA